MNTDQISVRGGAVSFFSVAFNQSTAASVSVDGTQTSAWMTPELEEGDMGDWAFLLEVAR